MQTIPSEIRLVLDRITASGNEAYIVGGAVRNMLLETAVNDYDITTSAHPNTIKMLFNDFNQYTAGKKYGTVVVLINNQKIDITTFRQDKEYSDHRHPDEVAFTTSLYEDLKRRDYTINALCLDKDGNLIDYFDGVSDLHKQLIKAIGNPNTRFNEDALRILRAIKFAARLDFDIEEETGKALFANAHLLRKIANERIKEEFLQILSYKNKEYYLNRYLEVFRVFIPLKKTDQKIDNFTDPYFALAYLLYNTEGYNLSELKYSRHEINLLKALISATDCDIEDDYKLICCLSSIYEKEILLYLCELHQTNLDERYATLKPYIADINSLTITGEELMKFGYKGPQIKEIKEKIVDEIRQQRLPNEHEAIINYLKKAGI